MRGRRESPRALVDAGEKHSFKGTVIPKYNLGTRPKGEAIVVRVSGLRTSRPHAVVVRA